MPIRSQRSRSSYAAVGQKLLRSPARLAGTLLVLVLLAVGISSLLGDAAQSPAGPAPAVGASPPTAPSAPTPGSGAAAADRPSVSTPANPPLPSPTATVPLVTPDVPERAAPASSADPASAAVDWARAWLDHGRGAQAWINGLQPYTTQEFLGELGTADVSQVPDGQVTGPASVSAQGASSATATVPTSAVVLQLELVRATDGWRVSNADQAS